jgi:hypothetical protein
VVDIQERLAHQGVEREPSEIAKSMDWKDIAPCFEPDGSLRDIYIIDSSTQDWQTIWMFLTHDPDRLTFSIDGLQTDPPGTVDGVFAVGLEHSVVASYALGKQTINCHFFEKSEIEFDLDPRDVSGTDDVDTLGQFMAVLGQLVSKPVILTQENDQAAVIARFDPKAGKVEWSRNSV